MSTIIQPHPQQDFQTWATNTALFKAYLRPEMVAAEVGSGWMAKALEDRIKTVHTLKGVEAYPLPLPDGSVDVVFAHLQSESPTDAIREMLRILKPGGRLALTLRKSKPDQTRAILRNAGLVNLVVLQSEPHPGSLLATGTRRIWMQQAVKNTYGERARSGRSCCGESFPESDTNVQLSGSSCCSDSSEKQPCFSGDCSQSTSEVAFIPGYNSQEYSIVPSEAGEIAMGCGNPTAMANLQPGETVLDIGSGGGMDAFLAARKVGPMGRVIGVDMTPAMLKRARASAKKAGLSNVEFRQGQAESLPVEDDSIDVALSNCVINLCEDKGIVFQEIFRVLKPGGRLEISDMLTDCALPLDARINQGEWAGCVSGALPEEEYLDLVAQAGFIQVTSRRSASTGRVSGVSIFSSTVSAIKPQE